MHLKMLSGDPRKINLSTSSFERIRERNCFYVDKTKFIEHFLDGPSDVQLIVRQRRLGKSLNMDMLRCFLTDGKDNRGLFAGTYAESSHVWDKVNSAPVFYFDFKNLNINDYKEQIVGQVGKYLSRLTEPDNLNHYLKRSYNRLLNNPDSASDSFFILTELVYELTGKRSYILIDEYDKLLVDNYKSPKYEEIRRFETALLSSGLKGNQYLEKALLIGVMRVSRESMLSGLNNLTTYDSFSDAVYTADFGLTDGETGEMQKLYGFDKDTLKEWYNGIKINGTSLYNIYSVLSFVGDGSYRNYWGRSGTVDTVLGLLNEARQNTLGRLLNGEAVKTYLNERISLTELADDPGDSVFFSLLVQTGYLSLEDIDASGYGTVRIPNRELRNVWKEFILSLFVKNGNAVRTLFDNIRFLNCFDSDVEYFLSDRLSYFDVTPPSDGLKPREHTYHVFVLGLLSAYEDISFKKPPLSNRESGDGRYDILFEKQDFSIIFEFKSVENENQLEAAAEEALRQIDAKRYCADAPKDKPLIKTAVAFCGKRCKVKRF